MSQENQKIKRYFDQLDSKLKKLPLQREEHEELKQLINACYVGIQNEYIALAKSIDRSKSQEGKPNVE